MFPLSEEVIVIPDDNDAEESASIAKTKKVELQVAKTKKVEQPFNGREVSHPFGYVFVLSWRATTIWIMQT